MNRNELITIITARCQDYASVILSSKPEWLIIKLSSTKDTFASIRLGQKFITVNIDTKLSIALKDLVEPLEGVSITTTYKVDHIQNKLRVDYLHAALIPNVLEVVYSKGYYTVKKNKDRRTVQV